MRFNRNKLELLRYLNLNKKSTTKNIVDKMIPIMTKGTCYKNLKELRKQRKVKFNRDTQIWTITRNGRAYISKYTLSYADAKEVHRKRSKRARKSDESTTAKNLYYSPTTNWASNPGSSDIWGIDSKKQKVKNINETKLYLISMYKRPSGKLLKETQFKDTNNKRTLLHIKDVSNSDNTRKYIKTLLEIRYNNIQIRRVSAKKSNKDFWITITN